MYDTNAPMTFVPDHLLKMGYRDRALGCGDVLKSIPVKVFHPTGG